MTCLLAVLYGFESNSSSGIEQNVISVETLLMWGCLCAGSVKVFIISVTKNRELIIVDNIEIKLIFAILSIAAQKIKIVINL